MEIIYYKCINCGNETEREDPAGLCDCERLLTIHSGQKMRQTMQKLHKEI